MSSCVLCGVDIVKNTDKNLVDGRRGNSFKVREELLSLECKVEINAAYWGSMGPNVTQMNPRWRPIV